MNSDEETFAEEPQDLGALLQGGALRNIPPNASNDEQIAAINDVIDRLNNMLQTQVFSDGTSKRMLIGYQEGGFENGQFDFGIKMARDGVDVTKATDDELLFSMSFRHWTWRNISGAVVKQFINETGTDTYFEPNGRNYVNVGLRKNPATYGLEMAKPGDDLGYEPS